MQSQPITTTPSTTPATPAPPAGGATDNDASTASETFGSVLARQRAGSDHADVRDGKPPHASTDGVASDAETIEAQQAAAADLLGMLPGDMLAVLQPAETRSTDASAGGEYGNSKALAITLQEEQEALRIQGALADAASQAVLAGTAAQGAIPAPLMAAAPLSISSDQIRTAADGLAISTDVSTVAISAAALAPSADDTASVIPRTPRLSGSEPLAMRQTTAATESLKTLHTEQANAVQLTTAHSGNDQLAPQFDISSATHLPAHFTATPAPQPGAPAQVVVSTPMGSRAWANDFNQSITWLASQHEQSAQLHLNPPNLGPLDVVLNVSDGQATALFTSPHAAVREAVEQALPRLREMLADSGITLGNATVSDQPPREQLANFSSNQLKGGRDISDNVSGAADITQSSASLPGRRHQGMVDTFA